VNAWSLACVALLLQPAARAADSCADMRPGLNQITMISGGQQQRDCRPSRPIAVLAVHGTDDDTNPFPGGGGVRWGYSVERAAARWANLDRCGVSPALEKVSAHVTRVGYGACGTGSEVVLYRIDAPRDQGGGHVWPGGRRDLSTRAPGRSGSNGNGSGTQPVVELNATTVVLEFFATR